MLSPQEAFNRCRAKIPQLKVEPLSERKRRLKALRDWIHKNRRSIHEAVYTDLRKPSVETDATEIFHVLNEIKVALSSLDQWARPKKVDAPLYLPGTRAWIYYEPRGLCLIISPWNYPFSLAAGPLVSALAAGNAAIIKPSEMTPGVSALIRRMCDEVFDPGIVAAHEGGVQVSQTLLNLPFDHIFFTGSPSVGKIVMKAAAEHLTSVTLELGGKSPAIVTASARIGDAAERIAVTKFLNNGQTCIAPDYVLADEAVADSFLQAIVEKAGSMFAPGGDFQTSSSYARIVNESNFNRIKALIDDAIGRGANVVWSGPLERVSRFMHPVILTNVAPDSLIMNEEIFGPVLPIVTYKDLDEALAVVHSKPKPLALYVFTRENAQRHRVLSETSSGTVCVNDCGIQFLHHELPFGGVNNSGTGKAHGHFGFMAFSNEKSVLKQKNGFTALKPFYPPYTSRTEKLMDWFLKLF